MKRVLFVIFAATALATAACSDSGGCLEGYEMCEDVCTNYLTNPFHCGDCETTCGLGETCVEGVCTVVCRSGLTLCGGDCVNTETNLSHCGACDNACPAGEVCVDGSCELVCGGTTDTLCGDACVDLNRNPLHCGVCDNVCAAGEICSGGACTLSCGGSTPTRCGDACVDTDTNRLHCGACDNACTGSAVCSDGSCGDSCGGSTPTVCGDACVDTDTNPLHCGACDNVCTDGEVCDTGSCETFCSTDLTDCSGSCRDLDADPDHCGACDAACPSPTNATGVCVSGACDIVCTGTFRDCNRDSSDGCEIDVEATDLANCGACGALCETGVFSSPDCTAGTCSIVCDTDYTSCSTDFMDGCMDLQTDPLNCSACGTACSTGELCITGSCVLPETCAQIVPLTTTDGPYTLHWGADSTKPWNAWCHDMAGTPTEYLQLAMTGPSYNFSQHTCGGTMGSWGTDVRTTFSRVRLDPATSLVGIGDFTFSTSTGSCVMGTTLNWLTVPYAMAEDCWGSSSARGLGNLDLTGTPFRVSSSTTWGLHGAAPAGAATRSSGDQVVDITGGGGCGWNAPASPGLELEYIP
ncbi:MAG: hypothetical protein JRG91_02325 [Deltaproteobacteria bacterium]|nr:hypothetical protein [Deltaproteobacteria bacterium]